MEKYDRKILIFIVKKKIVLMYFSSLMFQLNINVIKGRFRIHRNRRRKRNFRRKNFVPEIGDEN